MRAPHLHKLQYMKKIFTLIAAVMFAVCSYAQVNITDPEGKVYENGSTMDIYPSMVIPDIPDFLEFHSPELVNTSASAVNVNLVINIKQLPEGTTFAECFSGMCTNYGEAKTVTTKAVTLAANETKKTACEWFYDEEFAGKTCIADFTLYVNGKKDKTVTVRYINGDINSVNSVIADSVKKKGAFTIDGKRVANDTKGLVIKNGKKVIIK